MSVQVKGNVHTSSRTECHRLGLKLLAGTVECFQIYSLLLGGLNGEGITGASNVRALVVAF